jgi:sulfite exporter TauE/SafE
MLYAAFAMAVGTGSWLGGMCFMFAFAITQTFFMQLGISVGRLMGRKWSERLEAIFPWLCIALGMVYIVLFIRRLTPV